MRTTYVSGLLALGASVAARSNIILETDLFSDVDDVGALLLATTLKQSNLLAVNINVPSSYSALAGSALLGYYGHPDTPLGIAQPIDDRTFFDGWAFKLGEYTSKVGYHFREYSSLAWDADDKGKLSVNETWDAVKLYRKVLSEAEDDSITICSIGFFNNLSGLLNSTADEFSSLSGPQLIAAKVKELVIMGGEYPAGREYNFFGDNPLYTAHVVNNWQGKMTFSGAELGGNVFSGAGLMKDGPDADPAKKGYLWYTYGEARESWDPLTLVYAVLGLDDWFEYAGQGGRNHVFPNGSNEWVWDEQDTRGEQRWLKLKPSYETAGMWLDELYLKGAREAVRGCKHKRH
ncbi:Inosine/uridine-preferring nucleoside hydrolase domain-containing protein [Stachybotrys elegans]|uniref:Inosine/uridine-preferring nucleoside hydrolase domain-containing protein n=1 Tax=Stachybotrys elegans TaxID=80388 RepID=A0A8K0SIG3_9HYPO|nr:Inosine/uridine-preferring nucleoside hydrolase domain-containing protein [Stachybotrys elegans]